MQHSSNGYILAIDQGTTSTRAILFDHNASPVSTSQLEFTQHFPKPDRVEHDPAEIWQTTVTTCRNVLEKSGKTAADIAAIGITNQRETTIVWDKRTGDPVYPAIVWQDRRTAPLCAQLQHKGHENQITEKTGLLLDPYFSASKISWILDNVDNARTGAEQGHLLFGTVDCFLLWKLTGGKVHATDATNASRTMVFNIRTGTWDKELLQLFNIPQQMMPQVHDCAHDFGETDPALFGRAIKICGIAGDQHAATIGQACFSPGMMKSTYGTGCFAMLNTGSDIVRSKNRLLTTIAYQINDKRTYALEGSIFIAGAAVQWLRDGLKIIDKASASGQMARQSDKDQQVYMVPAFTGLGAPYWDADCRGAIFGLTRATGRDELVRAALEAVCYQTLDLIGAMNADWPAKHQTTLRVDGGMVASDWTMQFLADMLNAPVDRPKILETTALGAAYLAGIQAGIFAGFETVSSQWRLDKTFTPDMTASQRATKYAGWRDAVKRTLTNPN